MLNLGMLNTINKLVSDKTNGQITDAVIQDDLYRVKLKFKVKVSQ
jgi:serine protease inhibitor